MVNRKMKRMAAHLIFLAVFAGVAAIIMLLWNALIPSIIGWNIINYWQAAGLLILCRLLLGGFGKMKFAGMHMMHHGRNKFPQDHSFNQIHEKIQDMSSEERREFIRQRMRRMDQDFTYNEQFNTSEKPDTDTEP